MTESEAIEAAAAALHVHFESLLGAPVPLLPDGSGRIDPDAAREIEHACDAALRAAEVPLRVVIDREHDIRRGELLYKYVSLPGYEPGSHHCFRCHHPMCPGCER